MASSTLQIYPSSISNSSACPITDPCPPFPSQAGTSIAIQTVGSREPSLDPTRLGDEENDHFTCTQSSRDYTDQAERTPWDAKFTKLRNCVEECKKKAERGIQLTIGEILSLAREEKTIGEETKLFITEIKPDLENQGIGSEFQAIMNQLAESFPPARRSRERDC